MVRGTKCSQILIDLMKDIYNMRGGSEASKLFLRKTLDIHPFEDISQVESMSVKHDCSLFIAGQNQKKRPHNLTLGRVYNEHLLDMLEFGITNYEGIENFKAIDIDNQLKPILVF
mmetsp:Transcript_17008/g.26240  ORF Transcript_17008/g.26240 Transcript_17008/m.26240 type:complete len:115 (+) Transcript_17008:226-570(+)